MSNPDAGWVGQVLCKWCNGYMPFCSPVTQNGRGWETMGICWECYDVYRTAGEFAELVVLVKEAVDVKDTRASIKGTVA